MILGVCAVMVLVIAGTWLSIVGEGNQVPAGARNSGAAATTKATGTLVQIVLKEEGFVPGSIVIAPGDTVVFSTELDRFFWPASDLHPTHLLYSAFDPQEPLARDETWNFRFEKEGVWKYHDHLSPYYTGTVEVIAKR